MSDTKDEIVGKVLHGLRDAAPPEGMENRVMAAVRHRAAATPIRTRTPWRIASLVGSVIMAGVLSAPFFTAHRKTPQATSTRSQTVPMRVGNGPATPLIVATRNSPQSPSRRARFVLAASPKKDELAAVSYPAPPLPLTEQEKLLLRLVHKDDPVQLAMLDPAKRTEQYAGQRADFKRFFDPPPTGESK